MADVTKRAFLVKVRDYTVRTYRLHGVSKEDVGRQFEALTEQDFVDALIETECVDYGVFHICPEVRETDRRTADE